MIFDLILETLHSVIIWFIDLFPTIEYTSPDISGITNAISIMYYFLTKPIAVALLTSTLFWLTAMPIASLIKFIYRKIPGVS